jgi:hypothetical protein
MVFPPPLFPVFSGEKKFSPEKTGGVNLFCNNKRGALIKNRPFHRNYLTAAARDELEVRVVLKVQKQFKGPSPEPPPPW